MCVNLIVVMSSNIATGVINTARIWNTYESMIVITNTGLFVNLHLKADIYSLRQLNAWALSINTINVSR